MSEPVGNGPRKVAKDAGPMAAITGNSHKTREAEPEPSVPITRIIEGKVTTRKQPWYKRVGRSLIADDAQNVGDYLLIEVIVPTVKRMIASMVTEGTDRVLYGASVHRRAGRGTSLRNTPYDRMGRDEPRRVISREGRARHDFDEIRLESRAEALEVVDAMVERLERYPSISVADLYTLLGISGGSYADRGYGWTDLSSAAIREHPNGFVLDLPDPEPLR